MTTITLNDLPVSTELDRAAVKAVTGGFLGGLVPFSKPVSSFLPSINNYFIDIAYEQNIFQQNPTNVSIYNTGDTLGNVINNVNTSALSAASPMSFTNIAGLLPQ